ncbi:MAG: F0F1 ATP synthase subunit B [Azospirillaceae bacterium]
MIDGVARVRAALDPMMSKAEIVGDTTKIRLAEASGDGHGAWPVEIWLALALIAVIAIAWKPAKRSILGKLDDRARRIAEELEEAKRLREDAQASLANLQRKQRDAMSEAEEIIAHARGEAERLRAQAAEQLEEQLARREQQAMDRISQAESQAIADVRNLAVDVAIRATRQLLADQVDEAKGAALIDDAIKAMPEKLH